MLCWVKCHSHCRYLQISWKPQAITLPTYVPVFVLCYHLSKMICSAFRKAKIIVSTPLVQRTLLYFLLPWFQNFDKYFNIIDSNVVDLDIILLFEFFNGGILIFLFLCSTGFCFIVSDIEVFSIFSSIVISSSDSNWNFYCDFYLGQYSFLFHFFPFLWLWVFRNKFLIRGPRFLLLLTLSRVLRLNRRQVAGLVA